MNYTMLKNNLISDLKLKLAADGFEAEVKEEKMTRLNNTYDAICICIGENWGLRLNAEALYARLVCGERYPDILNNLVREIENQNPPFLDAEHLKDYGYSKNRLTLRVVSAERNKEILAEMPHMMMADLAICYSVWMEVNGENCSCDVNNYLLQCWGISEDTLREDALKSAPELKPATIDNMAHFLGFFDSTEGILGDENEAQLYVATAAPINNSYGAAVIAYPGFLEETAKKLGGSYFVLPSSIHEVLLFRDRDARMLELSTEAIKETVVAVNTEAVANADQLSAQAYHYDADLDLFESAADYENRRIS